MHECTVTVAATVLLVTHKQGFLCTFKAKGMEPLL
jgi:hypothetical protein